MLIALKQTFISVILCAKISHQYTMTTYIHLRIVFTEYDILRLVPVGEVHVPENNSWLFSPVQTDEFVAS